MKLATQLLIAPLLTAAVAVVAVATSTGTQQHEMLVMQERSSADLGNLSAASQAKQQLAEIHASVYKNQAIADSLSDATLKSLRADLSKQLDSVQAQLASIVSAPATEGDGSNPVSATDLNEQLQTYRRQLDKAVELTSVEINMGVAAMASADATFTALRASMQQQLDDSNAQRKASAEQEAQRAHTLSLLLVALAALATFGALGFGWKTQRRIVRDIQQAVAVSQGVAAGDLTQNISSDRTDEIGELLRANGHMLQQLRESLHTVQQATDSIRTAAEEIASGNTDLSQRTEEAAGQLQQTASSMTELTGTVGQTADSARTANQLASTASSVAQRGGAAVQQVISTMSEINSSSHRISDIIGTIDGIAFQTNILALNAAVEAARAGEQGRGFAVVASEVRSLAQRSADAARQIKTLIQASVEKVEGGTRQVQTAGDTMVEIVNSVQRVTDIIGEISHATAEQSSGIGQVNSAVSTLDQVTQQNAALVEQSAAAAESLKEQAGRLKAVLSRFQLDTTAQRASPPAKTVAKALLAKVSATRPATTHQAPEAANTTASANGSATAPAVAAKRTSAPVTAQADSDWESF